MKITNIKATPVNIPLEKPFWWTGGHYPGTSKLVIEVETDSGIVGLGECPSTDVIATVNQMKDVLIGKDPLDIVECERLCSPPWQIVQNTDGNATVKAFGGIEIALWDIRGKVFDMPLYKLLGGAYRKDIPFTEYFAFRPEGGEKSAKEVADYCVRMKEEHGSTFFEGKLILGDAKLEIETVKTMREALGDDCMIRLDSNMQWSLPTAIRVCREIEQYNIRNYEDPVATFEEMAELSKYTSIRFSTHNPDLRRAVALGSPHAFVTNFAVLGGIRRSMGFIDSCRSVGIDFWCYSGETGIGNAAYLHMVATMEHIREPSQSLFRWQIADVINEPIVHKNNTVPVPEGAGLGVTLNKEELARWHKDYVDNGPMNHFYNPGSDKYTSLPFD